MGTDNTQDTVLEEAESLVGGERLQHYGPPHKSFDRIAALWQAYIGNDVYLTGHDVCAMMILLKQSRARDGYHRDSAVDSCGYARLQEILGDPAYESFGDPLR